MAKLSQCQGYNEKILAAWHYCEERKVLGDLAAMVTEWEDIDDHIRYKYGARLKRVPVIYYINLLKEKILESNRKLTNPDLSAEHMAFSLYKFMEDHLPEKESDGRQDLL